MAEEGGRNNKRDYRPGAITRIGCIGMLMLAISIPLAAITIDATGPFSLLLPLVVFLVTAISMLVVWYIPARGENARQLEALQQQLAKVDERLLNLETIDAFERRLAQREAQAETTEQALGMTPSAETKPVSRPKHTE